MNYYERHIGDYLKDTAHLSLLEHGIYGRLLDIYYTRETGLPADQIARLVGARSEDEKAALQCVLAEFFVLEAGDVYVQSRCDEEIARYQEKKRNAQASAAASWEARRAKQPLNERNADAMQTHSGGNAPSLQTPVSIPKKRNTAPAAPPDGVQIPEWIPAQEWADFIAHRKAMRGVPFTDAAKKGVIRDLEKLKAKGHAPADLLSRAVTNGWRTVFEPKVSLANPADVARITVPGPPPSSFLTDMAAHRAAVEAERLARKQTA